MKDFVDSNPGCLVVIDTLSSLILRFGLVNVMLLLRKLSRIGILQVFYLIFRKYEFYGVYGT